MRRPPVHKWLRSSKVPLPPIPKIVIGPCPAYLAQNLRLSCYDPEPDTLYLLPSADRDTFMHEMGHVFDYKIIQPIQRMLLKKRYHIPNQQVGAVTTPGWFWGDMPQGPMEEGPEAGCEIFADLYMDVAMGSKWFRRPWFKRFIKKAYKEYKKREPK